MRRHCIIRLGWVLSFLLLGAGARGAAPTWTWVKGSSHVQRGTTYQDNGVYGTRGVAAAANTPGARSGATTWTGKDGRLWLFGGMTVGPSWRKWFNDLWSYDPATGNWTWVKGSDEPDGEGVYGTQGVAAADNTPGARYCAVPWVDASGKLWLFGGIHYSGIIWEYYNDLWCFDPATKYWTWVKGSSKVNQAGVYGSKGVEATANTPGGRGNPVTWTDTAGRLWLFGGGGGYNDLWRFNPSTKKWAWIKGGDKAGQIGVYGTRGVAAAANTPGGRERAAAWTDASGVFWLYGGLGYTEVGVGKLGDLWSFNPSSQNWTWVKGTSQFDQSPVYGTLGREAAANTPGSRIDAVTWTDKRGGLWLFCGLSMPDDLWRFDTATRNWAWQKGGKVFAFQGAVYGSQNVAAAANTPGYRNGAAPWTGRDGRLWLFGGLGYEQTLPGSNNDLWRLFVPQSNRADPAWLGVE